VLFRVTQAALVNVSQHAQAAHVKVNIRKLPAAVCLEIHDDGKSFEVERVLFSKKNKRLGLIGMRERVEMVGGSFSVESAPGTGTTIQARIPFSFQTKNQTP
jgi:signal transduction histidine kinase